MPLGRRVPSWAAGLLALLAQDRPVILTVDDIAGYLATVDDRRAPEQAIEALRELHWLTSTAIQGTWAFHPPGETDLADPYLELRAWKAKDPDARWALAGEACALHLGYLDRRFDGPVSVWLPEQQRPPKGLRGHVSIIRIGWGPNVELGPSRQTLARKRLDRLQWATGLPALGPEALLVQLAVRPSSFRPWADLAAHIQDLAGDCEPQRVVELVNRQSASAWQRAAYLLHAGDNNDAAAAVAGAQPTDQRRTHARLGEGDSGTFDSTYGVTDNLLAPLLATVGKA